MSGSLVLLVATEVYGEKTTPYDNHGNDKTTIAFPAIAGSKALGGARVLFVKGGDKFDVRDLMLANLYQTDEVTPKNFSILQQSYFCTLSSLKEFRYSICVNPIIVNRIYKVYRDDTPPGPSSGFRNSVHFIHLRNFGEEKINLQALVFFKNELFCKPDLPSGTALGVSFRNSISFANITGFRSTVQPNDNIFFLVVHKNSDSKCWCIQLLNAFHYFFDNHLYNIFNGINGFNGEEMKQFSSIVNGFEESDRKRFIELYDLFLPIKEYFTFCYSLKEVTVLDIQHLRCLIASCPLLGCRRGPMEQEDPYLLRDLAERFAEFHSYLLKIEIRGFHTYVLDKYVNPERHMKYQMSISYKCRRCQQDMDKEIIEFGCGFQVNPSFTAINTLEDFERELNGSSASFANIYCPWCKGLIPDSDVSGTEMLALDPGAKFTIDTRLNNNRTQKAREEWYIPMEDFLLGPNICRIRQIVMNKSTGDMGAHGHCYGGIIRGDFLYLLDDGAPPIPLRDLTSASETVSLLLCQVIGKVSDEDYPQFRTKVEEAQRIEYSAKSVNFIRGTMEGIEQNLHPEIKELTEVWETSQAQLHRELLQKKINEFVERITTLEDAINNYNQKTQEADRDQEVSEISRKLEEEKEYRDSLFLKLCPT